MLACTICQLPSPRITVIHGLSKPLLCWLSGSKMGFLKLPRGHSIKEDFIPYVLLTFVYVKISYQRRIFLPTFFLIAYLRTEPKSKLGPAFVPLAPSKSAWSLQIFKGLSEPKAEISQQRFATCDVISHPGTWESWFAAAFLHKSKEACQLPAKWVTSSINSALGFYL